MPNLARRGRERNNKYYNKGFEHDDRTIPSSHEGTRRVSFKNHGRRNKPSRQRGWDSKVRSLLQDDDVDMGSSNSRPNNERYNNNSGRKQNRNYNRERSGIKRHLPESPTYWYKVLIRHASRYDKDYLLKLLGNYIKPAPFIPIGYKLTGNDATFAIDDHESAEGILNADRRITLNDGYKLNLQIRVYNPVVEINPKLTETVTKVMASRYNPYNKALDLSKFHQDPNFLAEDIFCPLNKENVMSTVIGVISDSIPDLVAIDMSNNKITTCNYMRSMVEKAPNLKILHMGKNKLRDVKQLDALKGLNLEELVLDGNFLCDKFRNSNDDYIRAVRLRFPKVVKLDFVELPPPIIFDVGDDDAKLPPSQASFMCDREQGALVVRTFLEQYYQFYDSDSREPLIQAYHDNAQFSHDCYIQHGDPPSALSVYLQESRNLFRVVTSDRRIKLVRIGKHKIVEALNNLPRTLHDPTSFVVDLVLFTPTLIELNVCGLFKEKDRPDGPVKYFNRLFIIVPVGTGFCIVNEQLTVMLATADQIKKVAKVKEEATTSAIVQVPAPALDIATKQQMVTTLSLKSGMNLVWSEKCLTETNWNFDQALAAFMELHKTGSIPAIAFQK